MSGFEFDLKSSQKILERKNSLDDLGRLRHSLRNCRETEELAELARRLPNTLKEIPNRLSLELSRIAMELAVYSPIIASDVLELSPRLRREWLQAYLCAGFAPQEISESILVQVVAGWDCSGFLRPLVLLQCMSTAKSPRLRQRALELLPNAVNNLQMSAEDAFPVVLTLASDRELALRKNSIQQLSATWLLSLSPKSIDDRDNFLAEVSRGNDSILALASLQTMATLGNYSELRDIVADPATPLSTKVASLEQLGPVAEVEDIDSAISLAIDNPLAFATPARELLLSAHRHGVFVRESQLTLVLELFDVDRNWSGEEFVRVTYLFRVSLLSTLAELESSDRRWIRRATILGASYGVLAHELILSLLGTSSDPEIVVSLLRAAGQNSEFRDCSALRKWLAEFPEEVIPLLRCKGCPDSQVELRAIVESPLSSASLRNLALDTLWSLSDKREQLMEELHGVLGPRESSLLSRPLAGKSLGAQLLLASSRQELDGDKTSQAEVFSLVCHSGDYSLKTVVVEQFRALVKTVVAKALHGDFTSKRIELPLLEQELFIYGRHLVTQDRCVRPWVNSAPETGGDFLRGVLVTWLLEKPEVATTVAILEMLSRHNPSGPALRAIEGYWRHPDKGVQRAAIEAILASGEGGRGLELSICRLARDGEARILCQALDAVAEFNACWALPMVLSGLERPEMAVKKAAASALAVIGGAGATESILEWLSRHDNPGFRNSLVAALHKCAGLSANSLVIAALEKNTDKRTRDLLWDVLSGQLPLSLVRTLVGSDEPTKRELVQACLDGEIEIRDGSSDELAIILHRAKWQAPRRQKPDPTQRMRVEGFSASAAAELVEQFERFEEKNRREVIALVQHQLASWVRWLRTLEIPNVRGVNLLLWAANSGHVAHVAQLADLAKGIGSAIDSEALAGFVERISSGAELSTEKQDRIVQLLRTSPDSPLVGGLRRYRLLGRLGALRTENDVVKALAECRLRERYAEESSKLLLEVLQIPPSLPGDDFDLKSIRLQAENWSTSSDAFRDSWLLTMLAERPVDIPFFPLKEIPRVTSRYYSQSDYHGLVALLQNTVLQERTRAALQLLHWFEADAAHDVLPYYLDGSIDLDHSYFPQLARAMLTWPKEEGQRRRAESILEYFSIQQIRSFLPSWISDWKLELDMSAVFSDWNVAEQLHHEVEARLTAGDTSLVPLLRPSSAFTRRSLIRRFEDDEPYLISHLTKSGVEIAEEVLPNEDPVAGQEMEALVSMAQDKGLDIGLCVRALHALTRFGTQSVGPLQSLVVDRRNKVRSAALRALRKVASKEESLTAAIEMLKVETRRDIVLQLMRSLGHARFEPGLSAILERLTSGDFRTRQGAHAAMQAWGETAVPAIEHASRKARPDRRPAYLALIADIEG